MKMDEQVVNMQCMGMDELWMIQGYALKIEHDAQEDQNTNLIEILLHQMMKGA